MFASASYATRKRADQVYCDAFLKTFEFLHHTGVVGHVLEFGTFRGYTARLLARFMRDFSFKGDLYLYDSFQGLPTFDSAVDQNCYEVATTKVWFETLMAVPSETPSLIRKNLGKIIDPERIKIFPGYYEDTLPAGLPSGKAALVHIDCDLYASTKHVLEQLLARDLLQDGCVFLFDDWNASRANPWMGERRAVREVFQAQQRFQLSEWFAYGWGCQAFFVHDSNAGQVR